MMPSNHECVIISRRHVHVPVVKILTCRNMHNALERIVGHIHCSAVGTMTEPSKARAQATGMQLNRNRVLRQTSTA